MGERLVAWIAGAALSSVLTLASIGCGGIPDGVEAVEGFELERYLGTWYEIARLDHRFERGLSDVSAIYRMREDGRISVVNRGYDRAAGEWKEATGVARFAGDPDVGRLEVSFFGPFYGGYNVIELDERGYRYAMVVGPTRSYLWILARSPSLEAATVERLVAKAKALGFATDELIYVEHAPKSSSSPARLIFKRTADLDAKEKTLPQITPMAADRCLVTILKSPHPWNSRDPRLHQ